MFKIILTVILMVVLNELRCESTPVCRVVLVANSTPRPTAKGVTVNENLVYNDYEIADKSKDLSKNLTGTDPDQLQKDCKAFGDSVSDPLSILGKEFTYDFEAQMYPPPADYKNGKDFCSRHLNNYFHGTLKLYWVFKMSTPQIMRQKSGFIMQWPSRKTDPVDQILICPYASASPTTTKKP